MKIIQLLFAVMIMLTQQVWSNNVQVNNVRLTGQNTTDDFTMVEFDISWENSWRYANGPANWDAAWIFVKYRINSGLWLHARLNHTGHVSCDGTSIENGLSTPGLPFNSTTNPALGVFLYRTVPGSGEFSCSDVQLRWNYIDNGLTDSAQIDIQVFAIEMCYLPQGNFYVGSGGIEPGAFYKYPSTSSPYHITSEDAINVGSVTDYLFYNTSAGNSGDQSGPVPAAFPKGFKAFYAMKYEISQQAYVDFLNTLTRTQQQTRVASDVSGASVTNRFVMSNSSAPSVRNYISCRSINTPPPGVIQFFCDANNNGIGSETDDGQNVAFNYNSYGDVGAYLDWAALRLMTDFELEKCGRGPLAPVPNEYAWGNNDYYEHFGVLNINTENEIPDHSLANVIYSTSGPTRTGAFARPGSNRTNAGAGYYGVMELNSNLIERGVTIGTPTGRLYTGVHGNGELSATGHLDIDGWPSSTIANGVFIRGGSFSLDETKRLSNRNYAAALIPQRGVNVGGRGVRTAP